MNPHRSDLRLNPRQLELFDSHLWLIRRAVKRYGRWCTDLHFEDFKQHCRLGLCRAVKNLNVSIREPGAVLWMGVRQAAIGFLFGRSRFGSAEARDAAQHVSLDETVGVGEDGSFTRLDLFESDLAQIEINSERPWRNESAVFYELLRAAENLEPRERRFLLLKFGAGQGLQQAARRMGISTALGKRLQRSGVRKMRAHFAARGYRALAADARIPADGNRNGCPKENRKR